MATKKNGVIALAGEWWRHLRPFQKCKFWKKHRKAELRLIKKEKDE